ncbi:MAG: hypothetical protein MJ181_02760 [Treponema sp.]|nr:hypothetical protein [Treponema sp.]
MKKIITAVAAVAMAASMFAVDFSAATKIYGMVAGFGKSGQYSAADGYVGFLMQGNDSHDYANPNFSFSVADDKAGAAVKITTDGGTSLAMTTQTIWFKPADMLKITVGNFDVALNKERIDWTESFTGIGGNGFLASLAPVDGLSIDVGMNAGNGKAFAYSKNKGADATLAPTFFKAGYSADFGTIGGYVTLNKTPGQYDVDANYHGAHSASAYAGDKTVWGVDFGAGWSGSIGSVGTFVNVMGYMFEGDFMYVRPEVYVSGAIDAFGYNLFAAPLIWVADGVEDKFEMEVLAKVTYGFGPATGYVYFKDANVAAEKFTSTIKVGATGNVGICAWDVCVQIETGADFTPICVPFTLGVNF